MLEIRRHSPLKVFVAVEMRKVDLSRLFSYLSTCTCTHQKIDGSSDAV